MRWAQQQRLAFIGRRLRAGLAVNRRDLVSKFGVSLPQASTDLRRFDEAHPAAMRYDKSRKAYAPDQMEPVGGRDTSAAADRLMRADDAELEMIAHRDPGMIRDVAAALVWERND